MHRFGINRSALNRHTEVPSLRVRLEKMNGRRSVMCPESGLSSTAGRNSGRTSLRSVMNLPLTYEVKDGSIFTSFLRKIDTENPVRKRTDTKP